MALWVFDRDFCLLWLVQPTALDLFVESSASRLLSRSLRAPTPGDDRGVRGRGSSRPSADDAAANPPSEPLPS